MGKETFKILIDFRKSPRFSLTSPLSQLRKKSNRPVFTMCGEPWSSYLLYSYLDTNLVSYHDNQVMLLISYLLFSYPDTNLVSYHDYTTKSRDSEQTSLCARYSEQSLNIAENSEQILNITENSEQILNITEHCRKF